MRALILTPLSYLPFDALHAYSCPLCNFLWNIDMIFHSYAELVMTMCRVQEWQLSLSYFLSYFPLMVSDAISSPLHNLKILWYIIIILYSYVEQTWMMCRVQKWKLSILYFLSYFPLIVSDAISCPHSNLKTLWYIIMILQSYLEHILMICRVQE